MRVEWWHGVAFYLVGDRDGPDWLVIPTAFALTAAGSALTVAAFP